MKKVKRIPRTLLHHVQTRNDLAQFAGNVSVELGVRIGEFSRVLLDNSNTTLYAIDSWQPPCHHRFYPLAKALLEPYGDRCKIMRERFEKAVEYFPDEYFDFVYIDGFAHNGQDRGRTFRDWWPKVKVGGVFAGHDYCPHTWGRNFGRVNRFVTRNNLKLHTTQEENDPETMTFRSWFVFKEKATASQV